MSACEMCGRLLPAGYPWRARCLGCPGTHALCVDCGCRHARRIGLREPIWAELDACPAEVAAAEAVMGREIGEGAEEAAWRVMREVSGEPNDARTADRLLRIAREDGLPAETAISDPARSNAIGLRLADGLEVWSS